MVQVTVIGNDVAQSLKVLKKKIFPRRMRQKIILTVQIQLQMQKEQFQV